MAKKEVKEICKILKFWSCYWERSCDDNKTKCLLCTKENLKLQSKLRKALLCKENLTLIKLQEIAQNEEAANREASDIEQEKVKDPVNLTNFSGEHISRQSIKKCFKSVEINVLKDI